MARLTNSQAFGKDRKKKSTSIGNGNIVSIPKGSRKSKKRVGMGPGSGLGKTATRGQKGQWARTSTFKRGFEGGQMPIHKRLPKRGFTNNFKIAYQPVNFIDITKAGLSGEITPEILKSKNIIKSAEGLVKILSFGDIKSAVTIVADAISASAKGKLEKAGGQFKLRAVKAETSQSK